MSSSSYGQNNNESGLSPASAALALQNNASLRQWFRVNSEEFIIELLPGATLCVDAFLALATLFGDGVVVWPSHMDKPASKNAAKKMLKSQKRRLLTTKKRRLQSIGPSYKLNRNARNAANDSRTQIFYNHEASNSCADLVLRVVAPYVFTHECAAKARWVGRDVLSVLTEEFALYSRDYFVEAVANGLLQINRNRVQQGQQFKDGDILWHRVLCMEPATWAWRPSGFPAGNVTTRSGNSLRIVTDDFLEVEVFRDLSIMVVNKPGGIPVYPTGQFRQATVSKLLEREVSRRGPLFDAITQKQALPCGRESQSRAQSTPSIHVVHRLDTLVTGVLIVAVGSDAAKKLTAQLTSKTAQAVKKIDDTTRAAASWTECRTGLIRKEYYACVRGRFPVSCVSCSEPIKVIAAKHSTYGCGEGGKPARTLFKVLSYNVEHDISLVSCVPLTGRQHQIRVHLAFLGHPILNDHLYAGTVQPSDTDRRSGSALQQLLVKVHANASRHTVGVAKSFCTHVQTEWLRNAVSTSNTQTTSAGTTDTNCSVFDGSKSVKKLWEMRAREKDDFRTPDVGTRRFMLLHAHRYCNPGFWDFRVRDPSWIHLLFPNTLRDSP